MSTALDKSVGSTQRMSPFHVTIIIGSEFEQPDAADLDDARSVMRAEQIRHATPRDGSCIAIVYQGGKVKELWKGAPSGWVKTLEQE